MKKFLNLIKKNKLKTIIIFISVVGVIFITTFAFFFTTSTGDFGTITYGNINISYNDGNRVNIKNSLPFDDTTSNGQQEIYNYSPRKEFSVKNVGNLNTYLKIELTNIVIDNSLKSTYFKWALYNDNTKLSSGNFSNIQDNKIVLNQDILLPVGNTKSFRIVFWIQETNGNQNDMLNSTFNAKVAVTAIDKPQTSDLTK